MTDLQAERPATAGRVGVGTVGVVRERGAGERRVALVPAAVGRLQSAGIAVAVETGAGVGAWFGDQAYTDAGATVTGAGELAAHCDLLVTVGAPDEDTIGRLRPGQVVVGLLRPLVEPASARRLAELGVTAVSLDLLPRTLSRAQSMDALTSQANVAGYKAALVAADAFGRFFPMLITAAGTAKPADVLVLGAGVAGLQAMGTARRLGAMVTGYDVRPETREQVQSIGAKFLQLGAVGEAAGAGGYARALTAQEQAAQTAELDTHIAGFDVVITTAQVPGRRPPRLVTSDALARMGPGSVVVDLAAGPLGGNVEGSVPDATVVTDNGVTVIGAGNLPAQVPAAASTAFSNNVTALLLELVHDGALTVDPTDEIQAGVVVTHGGRVVNPAVAALTNPGGNP